MPLLNSEVGNWGLRSRLIVPIFVLVLLATLGLGAAQQFSARRQAELLVSQRGTTVLEEIAQRLQDRQRSREIFAQLLTEQDGLAMAIEQGDRVSAGRVLVPLKVKLGLERLTVYSGNGQELLDLGLAGDTGVTAPLVTPALSGLTRSIVAVGSKGLEVAASAPVKGVRGIVGALVVDAVLRGDALKAVTARDAVELAVFRDGKLVDTTITQPDLVRLLRESRLTSGKLGRLSQTLTRFSFLATARPLDNDDLLLALVPIQDVTLASRQRSLMGLAGSLILVIALAVVSLMLTRDIVGPIETMVAVATDLMRGNYQKRVPPTRIRELSKLTTAINHLAEQIQVQLTKLSEAALTDFLTGLPNRRAFRETMENLIEQAERDGRPLSLLVADLNDLKLLNDRKGHLAGDQALQLVGKVLRLVAPEGLAFRIGGDEFALLLPGQGAETARILAEQIAAKVREDREANESYAKIGVSIGVACYPDDAANGTALLESADEAMYQAKVGHRRSIEVYSSFLDSLGDKPVLAQNRTVLEELMWLLEMKERYTYSHSKRVEHYATALGKAIGLTSDDLNKLRWASYYHDLGKLGLDYAVLNKRVPLSTAEWEAVRQHPVWSHGLLRHVHCPASVLAAVLHHHERWDGSGYPRGLAGEKTPLLARILAVADSFDAMVSERPYRPALARNEALAELERFAGTQFDPALVPPFIHLNRQTSTIS